MGLPQRPKASPFPADLDPSTTAPGVLVQRLITRGRIQFAVVPYPRYDAERKPVAHVHVRLLTVGEQDNALANARLHVERLLAGGKKEQALDWRPEELEHNARITEILAIACREPENPEKPFFEHGTVDIRTHCTPEELGALANVYGDLMTRNVHLGDLSDGEMEVFLRAIKEGTLEHPFSFCSREQLEILCAFCVRWLAAQGAFSTGPEATSSS